MSEITSTPWLPIDRWHSHAARHQAKHREIYGLQRAVTERMLDSADVVVKEPQNILLPWVMDIRLVEEITRRWPEASIDFISPVALAGLPERVNALPTNQHLDGITSESYDLIVAHLVDFYWGGEQLWGHLQPLLKQDGVLLFSQFAVDTLKEWRAYLDDGRQGLNPWLCPDLHDVGDYLQNLGYSEIIMSGEVLHMCYRSFERMWAHWQGLGLSYLLRRLASFEPYGCVSTERWRETRQAFLEKQSEGLSVSYEVNYGCARRRSMSVQRGTVAEVPLTAIDGLKGEGS